MRRARAAALVFCALAAGCSPATRHKVLSTLFDGVPPLESKKPGAPAAVAVSTTAAAAQPPKVALNFEAAGAIPSVGGLMTRDDALGNVYHPPFQRQLCLFCHNFGSGTDRLRYPLPTLCFQCHGRLDEMGPTVHWPVRNGRCVTCHNPHQAPNKRLLRMVPPRLCFQCHNGDKLSHGPDAGQCLDCHNPHSSERPRLLKQ